MTNTITQPCVRDQACVDVCPVDCIQADPDDRMRYIDPEECIDCGACELACPNTAIFRDDDVPAEWTTYTEINALWFKDKDAARTRVADFAPAMPTR